MLPVHTMLNCLPLVKLRIILVFPAEPWKFGVARNAITFRLLKLGDSFAIESQPWMIFWCNAPSGDVCKNKKCCLMGLSNKRGYKKTPLFFLVQRNSYERLRTLMFSKGISTVLTKISFLIEFFFLFSR